MPKRIISIVTAVSLLLLICCGRVSYIIFSGNYMASSGYNSYKLVLDNLNETVYDYNLKKLNNNKTKLIAVIKPNEQCMGELSKLFNQAEIKEIALELSKGYPIIRDVNNYASCKHIKIFEVYCDEPINYGLKDVVSTFCGKVGEKSISFAVDAKGRLLDGDNEDIITDNYGSKKGVILCINREIQALADEEATKINKGAIVITDVNTNEVLAMSSAGNDGVNRCISNHAVGSIFKLVVAACALENDLNQIYYCNGEITVGDTVFSCQNKTAHKSKNMQTALENSCNCYFIKLALSLGSERLLKTAKDFGFGSEFTLTDDLIISSGSLPNETDLKSKGELALLGFGQGKLNTSPLHFCSVITAIANGGKYSSPNIIKGYMDNEGKASYVDLHESNRIMSDETSKTLRSFMRSVVENGTGKNADYKGNSAGKTSTAQSGTFVNDKEVLITWFAGFYPAGNPEYGIVVMVEDGKSGAGDCCPIFRSLVERIEKL